MKKTLLLGFLVMFFSGAYSQSDTLYTRNQKKIPCKITEIGESEIKYKSPDNPDGPVYVIAIDKVLKYSLAIGTVVMVRPDELSVENQHSEIMGRRSVIKIYPFSFVNNQITLGYEQVIKMGTNFETELGYINNSISPNTSGNQFYTSNGSKAHMSGFFFKPGIKFMVGQDYSLKGMKYAHPLKGRYIRIDAALSYMNFQDTYVMTAQNFAYSPAPPYMTTITTTYRESDINTLAYGAIINYGRQFILGNAITMDYYFGVGIAGQADSKSNVKTSTKTDIQNNGYYNPTYYVYGSTNDIGNLTNYHGFYRWPSVGLCASFGFRIGFLLPEKKKPLER
ncbi:MAG TPA: hypothetical protein PLQ93_02795 [Bacteroidia bacterium]|nr:hypothetical protein [Bacteroidia bacterium]